MQDKVVSPVAGISLLSSRQFQEKHRDLVIALQSVFQKSRYSGQVPLQAVASLVGGVEELIYTIGVLNQIKKIVINKEDYTFRHSINVAIVAGLTGKWLGLENKVLRELILAGILHDIGKTQIPLSILNKPGDLSFSEMGEMKRHPLLGYQLLQSYEEIPQLVKLWILQHHERLDGSGYPYAREGSQVSYHAQIIAVADIYDAMTSNRVYRNAATPFGVIEELCKEMFGKLDPLICTTFLDKLNESLIGNSVRLNNGAEAIIIHIDFPRVTKPLIKTSQGECIDLAKNQKLHIVEVYCT